MLLNWLLGRHDLEGFCWCKPSMREVGNTGLVIVHNDPWSPVTWLRRIWYRATERLSVRERTDD